MPQPADLATLKRLLDSGAQLVEVLPREEYEHEHLPRARSLPLEELNAESASSLDRSKPIVVYCYDGL
jgi:rhodanese-related sulfurtransferase